MELVCPVCSALTTPDEQGHCSECGALSPRELYAPPRKPEAPPDADRESQEIPAGPEFPRDSGEILLAFRRQFEDRQVAIPSGWIERLRRLSTEVEPRRRFATTFFVDLRGYTRLSTLLSPEQIQDLLKWFYGVCTRSVERYGGFIIQFLGDGVFAAFGAPWAFERDSESALLCLLEIREEIRRKGEFEGHALHIRAGAANGVLNVSHIKELERVRPNLIGSVVNLSSRLMDAAETDQILVSDILADEVGGLFELEPGKPFVPKNFGREVCPAAVIRHKGTQADRRRHDAPFVGRQKELSVLEQWIQNVLEGRFCAARILGEPGIGKTRLVLRAIELHARAPLHLFQISGEPHHRFTLLYPLLQFLRVAASSIVDGKTALSSDGEVFDALRSCDPQVDPALIPTLGFVLGIEPHHSRLRSLPATTLRAQVVSALTEVVQTLARIDPWLLFIDDTQWCDQLTLEVLDRLARNAPPGLLLLAVGRTEEDVREGFKEGSQAEPGSDWIRGDYTGWKEIRLDPLSPDECRELLAHLLDPEGLHPLLRRWVLEETEGIPLYLIEMVAEVADLPEAISSEEISRRLAEGVKLERPGGLVDLLQARIDRLDSARRTLLEHGAVLGRRFSFQLMASLRGAGEEILGELYALRAIRMLRAEPMPDDIEFVFTSLALRDVAYQMLTDPQRRKIHASVAELLESRFSGRLENLASDLAFHWVRAGHPDRARPYVRKSAQRAIALAAPQEAYDVLLRALRQSHPPEPRRETAPAERNAVELQQVGLLEELAGKASRALGDYPAALAHFDSWAAIALKTHNPLWKLDANYQRAVTLFEMGRLDASSTLLEELLDDATVSGERAKAFRKSLAGIKYRRGHYDDALQDYLAVAQNGDAGAPPTATRADAWNNAGLACWQLGRLDDAARYFDIAQTMYSTLGNLYGQALCINNQAILAEKRSDLPRALRLLDTARELAESIGYIHGLAAIETNRGNIAILLGLWEKAQQHSARALRFARMIRHTNSEAIALENLALALEGTGFNPEATARIDEAIAICRSTGDLTTLHFCLLDKAWICLKSGLLQEAETILNSVPADLSHEQMNLLETLRLATRSLTEGWAGNEFQISALDEFGRATDPANHLRRLDASILLAERGVPGLEKEALTAYRRRLTSQASRVPG